MANRDPPKDLVDESDEEYESDDEVDAGSCGIMLTCLTLLLGGGMCGFGIYAGSEGYGAAWTAYIGAALGFVLFLLSFVGCIGFCTGRSGILASVRGDPWAPRRPLPLGFGGLTRAPLPRRSRPRDPRFPLPSRKVLLVAALFHDGAVGYGRVLLRIQRPG